MVIKKEVNPVLINSKILKQSLEDECLKHLSIKLKQMLSDLDFQTIELVENKLGHIGSFTRINVKIELSWKHYQYYS